MPRRRWVAIDGELVEVTSDYVAPVREHNRVVGDRHYDGLRATDGTDISTRSKHRAYMKANDLTTMDDFKDRWAGDAKRRAGLRAGIDSTRREAVARAFHDDQNRRRK
jgi:hypothetical protein